MFLDLKLLSHWVASILAAFLLSFFVSTMLTGCTNHIETECSDGEGGSDGSEEEATVSTSVASSTSTGETCIPKSCEDLSHDFIFDVCGSHDDGCGAQIKCDVCSHSGSACGWDSPDTTNNIPIPEPGFVDQCGGGCVATSDPNWAGCLTMGVNTQAFACPGLAHDYPTELPFQNNQACTFLGVDAETHLAAWCCPPMPI